TTVRGVGRGGVPGPARSVVVAVGLGRAPQEGTAILSSCSGTGTSIPIRTDVSSTTTHTIPLSSGGDVCIESALAHTMSIDVLAYSTNPITDLTQAITPFDQQDFSDPSDFKADVQGFVSSGEGTRIPRDATAVIYDLALTGKTRGGELRVWAPHGTRSWAVAKFQVGTPTTTRVIFPLSMVDIYGTSCFQTTADVVMRYRIIGYVKGTPTTSDYTGCGNPPRRTDGLANPTFTYVSRGRNLTVMTVNDFSGRNLTVGAEAEIDTPKERTIYVSLKYPSDVRGNPTSRKALPMRIEGVYRTGTTPLCSSKYSATRIEVCVSFPLTEQAKPNFRDIVNQPGDVSAVIDLLLNNTQIAGSIDTSKIWYVGNSMGGITGLAFIMPANRDPRIKAIISNVGAAGFWLPENADINNWKSAPPILMTNRLDDQTITYQFVRKTLELALPSGRVTALAYSRGGHVGLTGCSAGESYAAAWEKWAVFGGRAPSETAVNRSTCARFGIQPGGSTGWGAADELVPARFK
ncbi:MAG: hypothetical protein ACKODY_12850, partial [Actinomycetota bacterium]